MNRLLMIPFITIFSFCPCNGQSSLDALEGEWKGSGQLFKYDASFEMIWEQVLEKKFMRLVFHNQFRDKTGTIREMNAIAFYQFMEDSVVNGQWFDSRGEILPIQGRFENSALTIFWGNTKTEEGKTIYKFTVNGEVEVEDYFLKDNEYHLFGKARYYKRDPK